MTVDLGGRPTTYNEDIAKKPQVIAANKIDAIYDINEENGFVDKIKKEFEPKGLKVFPISAVSGEGVRELLFYVKKQLDSLDQTPIIFKQEFFPNDKALPSVEVQGFIYENGDRVKSLLQGRTTDSSDHILQYKLWRYKKWTNVRNKFFSTKF